MQELYAHELNYYPINAILFGVIIPRFFNRDFYCKYNVLIYKTLTMFVF